MKKSKRNNYIFLIVLLACVLLVGWFLKSQLATMQNEFVLYVDQTTTTLPTTTTIQPRLPQIVYSCETDEDCDWLSVNCCLESAGADWKCVSKQSDVSCEGVHPICQQVVRPKPTSPCICSEGVCTG
jgi:hypothetical protein